MAEGTSKWRERQYRRPSHRQGELFDARGPVRRCPGCKAAAEPELAGEFYSTYHCRKCGLRQISFYDCDTAWDAERICAHRAEMEAISAAENAC